MNIINMKRITAFVCSSLLTILSSTSNFYVSAQEQQEVIHNLVLFAQFPDAKSDNFMSENTQRMINYCEDKSTFRSLAGYINEISYGKMQVEFEYPQLKNDVFVPYKMTQTLDKYYNIESIMTEVISNADVPQSAVLDGNGDGIIDNIIVVMDADKNSAGTIFWPKAFSLPGIKINGLESGMVNVHNDYSLFSSSLIDNSVVLCHEFLHSVGYPDLYRIDSREGVPVGMWDIMAATSYYMQYPLAYERYKISHWLDAENITQNGYYTLSPASSRNGNRLYLLKTPLSDTEFFAVEYRKQGKAYSDEMDVKVYGTGLVVYRVNTEIHGNHNESGDEIYVFRPEETELDAGKGNPYLSAYGSKDAPDSVGSLDMKATIADGALVYSDGTNSGIKLSDIKITDDELSFKAEFADTDNADVWKNISMPNWINQASSIDICADENNQLFLLSENESNALVSRYSDGNWDKYTSEIPEKAYNAKLCMNGNIPYVLYNDSTDFTYVIAYYENGKWNTLLKGTQLSQYQDFQIYKDKIYLAYTTGEFPYALHLLSYDLKTGQKTDYADGSEDVCNVSIAVNDDEIAVSYRGVVNSSAPAVDIWKNGTYSSIKLSDKKTGTANIISKQNSFIISSTDDSCSIFTVKNGEITEKSFSEILDGRCYFSETATNGISDYLIVNTQNTDALYVFKIENDSFIKTGNSLCNDIVNNPSAVVTDNAVYTAYLTLNGNVMLKQYNIKNQGIAGDVNADGKFNISDAVILQKWLISGDESIKLANWKSADLCEDNILNIYDLCEMKKMLCRKSN